tara:strand:- start:27 stop:272 length:246 start_codon:yes stop_codon:yes gene_type:complete
MLENIRHLNYQEVAENIFKQLKILLPKKFKKTIRTNGIENWVEDHHIVVNDWEILLKKDKAALQELVLLELEKYELINKKV